MNIYSQGYSFLLQSRNNFDQMPSFETSFSSLITSVSYGFYTSTYVNFCFLLVQVCFIYFLLITSLFKFT